MIVGRGECDRPNGMGCGHLEEDTPIVNRPYPIGERGKGGREGEGRERGGRGEGEGRERGGRGEGRGREGVREGERERGNR